MATQKPEQPEASLADIVTHYLLASNVPVQNNDPNSLEGRWSRYVKGTFNRKTGQVNMWEDPEDPVNYAMTLAHELSHAMSNKVKGRTIGEMPKYGYNQMIEDIFKVQGIDPRREVLGGSRKVREIEKSALDVYKKHRLPSSHRNSFEEVRAELTAYLTLKDLGIEFDEKEAAKYEEVLDSTPEFRYWMESGLGGRWVSTPRLKEPQTALTGQTAKPSRSTPESRYSKDSYGMQLLKYLGVIKEDGS